MAALTGKPGVVLVGVGPGAASTVNGIAYARLERAPLLLFTDGPASSLHLAFDQSALFAPITKSQGRLRPGDGRARINPISKGLDRDRAVDERPATSSPCSDDEAHACSRSMGCAASISVTRSSGPSRTKSDP